MSYTGDMFTVIAHAPDERSLVYPTVALLVSVVGLVAVFLFGRRSRNQEGSRSGLIYGVLSFVCTLAVLYYGWLTLHLYRENQREEGGEFYPTLRHPPLPDRRSEQ